ncbi:hypothetical protein JOL62DRAFT_560893 [Phyllosticta paracitricarpa]|uniref:Uncharacterized protein n=1 Tax=Phyllosticta paracitricarpa TaxID=2016321 RepID=A0ABR1MRP5_9PEZI
MYYNRLLAINRRIRRIILIINKLTNKVKLLRLRITINLYSSYFNITYYTIYRYLLLVRRDSYYIVGGALIITRTSIAISIGDILITYRKTLVYSLYLIIYITIGYTKRKGGYKLLYYGVS